MVGNNFRAVNVIITYLYFTFSDCIVHVFKSRRKAHYSHVTHINSTFSHLYYKHQPFGKCHLKSFTIYGHNLLLEPHCLPIICPLSGPNAHFREFRFEQQLASYIIQWCRKVKLQPVHIIETKCFLQLLIRDSSFSLCHPGKNPPNNNSCLVTQGFHIYCWHLSK